MGGCGSKDTGAVAGTEFQQISPETERALKQAAEAVQAAAAGRENQM